MTNLLDLPNAREFTWHDGPRTVHFGEGKLHEAPGILAAADWSSYELLTTPRALEDAGAQLANGASKVHEVPSGKVADLSAALLDEVASDTLVALGGGRVIDTAKAIAAVREGRVAGIPTTLSGAEITGIHRLPEGHRAPRLCRPTIAICGPRAMTSLPENELRATAMNSLSHGADALFGPVANPVSSLVALRGIELIATAIDAGPDRDRTELALGSILCAHAIDGAGLSLHHAVSQELVRGVGVPHAETNAAMLPHTMEMMRSREPAAIAALAEAIGTSPDRIFESLTELGGGERRLGELGGDRSKLEPVLESIHGRLGGMQDTPSLEELRALAENAW